VEKKIDRAHIPSNLMWILSCGFEIKQVIQHIHRTIVKHVESKLNHCAFGLSTVESSENEVAWEESLKQ